jgi:hypothetical protein
MIKWFLSEIGKDSVRIKLRMQNSNKGDCCGDSFFVIELSGAILKLRF